MATSYGIKIKTGDKLLAGTDAQVTVQLFGTEGVSEPLPLNKSTNHTNKFERGQIDQFEFHNIPQLGDLNKLILWHDNGGLLSGWQLDYIEVTVSSNKAVKRFFFDAKKWIGGKVKQEIVLHHHN